MIKTFRGLLADGGQDRIRLQTIKGKVGYKIIKFQPFPQSPGFVNQESLLQIFKSKQTTVPTGSATCDFTDSDLMAAAMFWQNESINVASADHIVVFDNETVNQDIYITHTSNEGSASCNYYLELEVIPLDDAGAEYTTLKDMRQS